MNEQQILWHFGGIGAAALACQWLAWRLKLPAILFLLLTGISPALCWAGSTRRKCSARC
jgi:NhaP-type Na+/H+ or K+/H+ antiporter